MIAAPIPADEHLRLRKLYESDLLDTPNETEFDDIVRLASQICQMPISLISLVDANRQWFKAKVGLNVEETGRDISFCGHAISQLDIFEVPDARVDERFHDNPLVTDFPSIRFYAGVPLVTQNLLGHEHVHTTPRTAMVKAWKAWNRGEPPQPHQQQPTTR